MKSSVLPSGEKLFLRVLLEFCVLGELDNAVTFIADIHTMPGVKENDFFCFIWLEYLTKGVLEWFILL